MQSKIIQQVLYSLIIAVSIFALYYRSLDAPFILDDTAKVGLNPDIRNFKEMIRSNLTFQFEKNMGSFYHNSPDRPFASLTYAFNYAIGKLDSFGYHVVNVGLHLLISILLFFFLKQLLLLVLKREEIAIPFLTALLFGIHPVNTAVAAYTYKRADQLAGCFYILSLLFFLMKVSSENKTKRNLLSGASLGSFILALSGKAIAVTLPAILLLLDFVVLKDEGIQRHKKSIPFHIAFWMIVLFYLGFLFYLFGDIGNLEAPERYPRWSYLLNQSYALVCYIKLIFIPIGLAIDHPIRLKTAVDYRIIISCLCIVCIFLVIIYLYRKKTPYSKLFLFSLLWFFITISPTSSFFPTTRIMEDSRIYLSGLGFLFGIVLGIFYIAYNKYMRRSLYLIFFIYLSILSYLSYQRLLLYNDIVLLWKDVVSQYPKSTMAHASLGTEYFNRKEYIKALEELHYVLKQNPTDAFAHTSIGMIYHQVNMDYDKAIEHYKKAMESAPRSVFAYTNLGIVYYERKDYLNALQIFTQALVLDPSNYSLLLNLGLTYGRLHQYEKAVSFLSQAIEVDPQNTEPYLMLGLLYHEQKYYEDALKIFKRAHSISPRSEIIILHIGNIYTMQRRYDLAIDEYKKALAVNSNYGEAYFNIGVVYYYRKDYVNALHAFEKVVGINPSHAVAKENIQEIKKLLQLKK